MADNIYIYQTSPNQKTIITKKTASGAKAPYGIFNLEATLKAAKTLTDRAFKLYVRMNLHQNKHTYALSPAEIFASVGMSDKRYREAVKELIEKGYIVHSDKYKNVYIFYESPQTENKVSLSTPNQPDCTAISGVSSDEHSGITRPLGNDNPSISGGEIVHNITSHNTDNNTVDSKSDEKSIDLDYRSIIIQREHNATADNCYVKLFDDDDKCIYEKPEDVEIKDSFLDDEDMPF